MLPIEKLEQVVRRYGELEELLCRPDVLADRGKLSKLNKERSDLEPLVGAFAKYRDLEKRIHDDEEALADPELRELVQGEIRSGEGGEEAALFAADLFRMYSRYAEAKAWSIEILSTSESATGGIKECIA